MDLLQYATFITSHLRRGILHATSPSLPAGHVCGVVGFALEPFQDPHRLTGISAAVRLRGSREGDGGGKRKERIVKDEIGRLKCKT
jgi:hypothetical protein